jgi:hypothetical protein
MDHKVVGYTSVVEDKFQVATVNGANGERVVYSSKVLLS